MAAKNGTKYVTVWDGDGNECTVRMVDAREIVANGGSSEKPIPAKYERKRETHLAEKKVEESTEEVSTEEEPKKPGRKKKVDGV